MRAPEGVVAGIENAGRPSGAVPGSSDILIEGDHFIWLQSDEPLLQGEESETFKVLDTGEMLRVTRYGCVARAGQSHRAG